jgi:hypothetical protein
MGNMSWLQNWKDGMADESLNTGYWTRYTSRFRATIHCKVAVKMLKS